jgi:ABC-type antimicrobial peptide transport system permease subunit
MRLLILGLGIGLGLTFPAGRVMKELVFQVDPTDPLTFFFGAVLLSIVALAACAPPAFRASRTDPLEALREE